MPTEKKKFEFLLNSTMFCDLNIIYDKKNPQKVEKILALAVKCKLLDLREKKKQSRLTFGDYYLF